MKKTVTPYDNNLDNPHKLPIGSEYREVTVSKATLKWLHGSTDEYGSTIYLNATVRAGELYLWGGDGLNLHAHKPLLHEMVEIGTLDERRIVPMVFNSARLMTEIAFYGGNQVRFVFYRTPNGGQWDGGCVVYIEDDRKRTNVTHIVQPLPNVDHVLCEDRLSEVLEKHDLAFAQRQPMKALLASGRALKDVFNHDWSPVVWQIEDIYVATELDATRPSKSKMFAFFAKRGDLRGDI